MFITCLFSSRHPREPPSQYTTRWHIDLIKADVMESSNVGDLLDGNVVRQRGDSSCMFHLSC